jgi:hypothetical protein
MNRGNTKDTMVFVTFVTFVSFVICDALVLTLRR